MSAISSAVLSSCATAPPPPPPFGNFGDLAPEHEVVMARDFVRQLLTLHPPSQSRLNLRHPTPDAFGVALVGALRGSGYAVSEFAGPQPARGAEQPERQTRDQRADAGVDLRYIVDRPEPDLYRVTVFVAVQSLSRAYTHSRGQFLPFGAWVRKE